MSLQSFDSYMEILDRSATKRVEMNPEDILNLIELGTSNDNREKLTEIRLGLLFSLIVKRMEQFSGQELIRLMLQTHKLNVNPNKYYNNYFSIWEMKIIDKMIADKTHLYEILTIYVEFHEDFPEELVETWSRMAVEQIDEFSHHQLVQIGHIFATKKVRPSPQFIEKWALKVGSFINDANSDDLANVIYSCGKLNINELNKTFSKIDHQKILSMNGQQLTKTWYGLVEGKITMENDEKLKSEFVKTLNDHIKSFTIHDLARIIWCMSKTVQLNEDTLWSNWEKATNEKLHDPCNSQDLNMILTSLSRMNMIQKLSFSTDIRTRWTERAEQVMDDFWPEMLPNMVNDLCTLGERPTDQFIRLWLKRIKETLPQIFGRDLITIIVSLADNNYMIKEYDPDFFSVWCDEAKDKSSFWNPSAKTKLNLAFEKMGVESDEKLASILN